MKVEFQTSPCYVTIDGMAHIVHRNEALLAQRLWKTPGEWVATEALQGFLNCSARSIRVYATTLRSIFNLYGWHIESRPRRDGAYRMVPGKNTHDHRGDK